MHSAARNVEQVIALIDIHEADRIHTPLTSFTS